MSIKILLVSHGELAAGAASSARMIIGDVIHLDVICLEEESGIEVFRNQIRQYYTQNKDCEILTICDLPNGSPYITACSESSNLLEEGTYTVIAGLNLGMILSIIGCIDAPLEEVKGIVLDAGISTMVEYKPPVMEDMEEEL
ncbi:MAG: hypothetical protein HFJ10_12920 [Lachnospiraceae bacterium]|jgi:PTS system mannose-specific IIA component|nr:hypothetical protein [Lachnospiraceae bacterium]